MTALMSIAGAVQPARPPVISGPMAAVYYMLRLHPNFDFKAERQLHARGFTSAHVVKEKRSMRVTWGRTRVRDVASFPGIMFIADYDAYLPQLKAIADGISGFVRYDGEALKVSPFWMARILAFEQQQQAQIAPRRFKVGQRVAIKGGAWDLWEGKIAALDPHNRIKVLIDAMIGEVPIVIDEDQVEAVSPPGKAPKRASGRKRQTAPRGAAKDISAARRLVR